MLIYINILSAHDTAFVIGKNNKSMGVFQPLIYGYNEKIDISTHPILFFIKPNIKLKIYHSKIKNINFATRYSFEYITPLLKLMQHRGYFALISEDPNIGKINQILTLKTEILGTKKNQNYTITGKAGISICPRCKIDDRHIIDYDLIYPRMVLYKNNIDANLGLDINYYFSKKILFKTDLDLIFIPKENPFIEHKFIFNYILSKKYTLSAGYKYCYGFYPFNKDKGQWNLFPLIDIKWNFRINN
tara:strand:- start:56 stop:790 length:735 start_codon:yes stop_codon:yes gene_type:complete